MMAHPFVFPWYAVQCLTCDEMIPVGEWEPNWRHCDGCYRVYAPVP
jgi:hypothetical protein